MPRSYKIWLQPNLQKSFRDSTTITIHQALTLEQYAGIKNTLLALAFDINGMIEESTTGDKGLPTNPHMRTYATCANYRWIDAQ